MKKEVIIIALIAVLFVLVAASIVASFSFYKEYKDKVDYLEQQSQSGKNKIDTLEAKIDNFKSSIDDVVSQAKTYNDSIKAIQNTVTLSEEERKTLLAKIEEMKADLQGVQKDYSTAMTEIKQNMAALQSNIDKIGSASKEVELGKITVKQDDKKAAPKKAEGSNNFKSGNVRKVGSF
ncbi:MAG: hypothetical protein PHP46_04410 [Candidatus Omnitrophica bacterium]|nr:hypothetical protein [Candidatus Omnitrophota bacterium]